MVTLISRELQPGPGVVFTSNRPPKHPGPSLHKYIPQPAPQLPLLPSLTVTQAAKRQDQFIDEYTSVKIEPTNHSPSSKIFQKPEPLTEIELEPCQKYGNTHKIITLYSTLSAEHSTLCQECEELQKRISSQQVEFANEPDETAKIEAEGYQYFEGRRIQLDSYLNSKQDAYRRNKHSYKPLKVIFLEARISQLKKLKYNLKMEATKNLSNFLSHTAPSEKIRMIKENIHKLLIEEEDQAQKKIERLS